MDMTISAETIGKLNSLSPDNKKMVVRFIDQLDREEARRPKRWPKPDLIGIALLKLNDLFGSRKPISDEEIDAVIASVRAERRARETGN